MIVVTDAQQRAVVRLPDGRTARLISLTGPTARHKPRARVQLPSGAYLTVATDALVLESNPQGCDSGSSQDPRGGVGS